MDDFWISVCLAFGESIWKQCAEVCLWAWLSRFMLLQRPQWWSLNVLQKSGSSIADAKQRDGVLTEHRYGVRPAGAPSTCVPLVKSDSPMTPISLALAAVWKEAALIFDCPREVNLAGDMPIFMSSFVFFAFINPFKAVFFPVKTFINSFKRPYLNNL